jgi:rod shape-determining protein MreD
VAGFGTGLLLDVLPPATHALGQWAFVFCLLGHLVGMLARAAADSVWLAVALGAVGSALAPLLFTLVGLALGDPRAHLLGALEHLPSVALWTLVVAVFVLGPAQRGRRDRAVPVDALPVLAPVGAR